MLEKMIKSNHHAYDYEDPVKAFEEVAKEWKKQWEKDSDKAAKELEDYKKHLLEKWKKG